MKDNIKGSFLTWIVVKDLHKSRRFFEEVVGLKVAELHEQFGWMEVTGPDGARVGVAQEGPQEMKRAGTHGVITFTVKDIEKAKKHFEHMWAQWGASFDEKVMEIPGMCKLLSFHDQDGNHFQLYQDLKA